MKEIDLPVAVVGTAGHIDHGKSSLVRALTGVDPDRLPEEKLRGITIELGYAPLRLPSGRIVSIVDVPGHERFIKTMAAGAAVVDLAILVVDASEGVKPQSVEHLHIMQALGVRAGVVAMTKCDAVDQDLMDLAIAETRELLAGSFLEGASIVPTSAVTGEGLGSLCACLDGLVGDFRTPASRQPLRIPIDRAFVMAGFGTVVTGTLIGGSVSEDETVEVLPLGATTRVRGLQVHDGDAPKVLAPSRVALNLVGVEKDQGLRGQWIVRPSTFRPTRSFLARVRAMPWIRKALKLPAAMSLNLGSMSCPSEVGGPARGMRQAPLTPGEELAVRVDTEEPVVPRAGDRFILRVGGGLGGGFSTAAGGMVIDPLFTAHRIGPALEEQVGELDAESPASWIAFALRGAGPDGLALGELTQRVPAAPAETQKALEEMLRLREAVKTGRDHIIGERDYSRTLERAREALGRFHAESPERAGIKKDALRDVVVHGGGGADIFETILRRMVKEGVWKVEGDLVSEAGHAPSSGTQIEYVASRILALVERSGAAPPALKSMAEELGAGEAQVRKASDLLIASGRARLLDGEFLFSAGFLERLEKSVREFLSRTDRLLVTDLKTIAGVTRKHALPLARWLDDQGVTLRRGEYRILRK